MTNSYRATSVRAKALYGDDVFDETFTVTEERDQIDGGHLEIVPRSYEVLSNNYSAGKQGEFIELALLSENEAALIAGSHIKRAERPTITKKKG